MNQPKQKEIVVSFEPTGHVHGLHHDSFDLGFLGNKKIARASTIEFDEEQQSFYVLVDGEDSPPAVATGFSGYDVARDFEVRWLQECMLARVHPHSTKGLELAKNTRSEHFSDEPDLTF